MLNILTFNHFELYKREILNSLFFLLRGGSEFEIQNKRKLFSQAMRHGELECEKTAMMMIYRRLEYKVQLSVTHIECRTREEGGYGRISQVTPIAVHKEKQI